MSIKRSPKRRKALLDKLYGNQNGKCYWCRVALCTETRDNDKIKDNTATFDHKVPKASGGSEKESNIVLACYKCNNQRGNTLAPPRFREKNYTSRRINEAGEELLDLYFPVLDYGFIALKDYMGTDACIEDAARTSYGHGTKKKSSTFGLIRYLMRHEHMSPFEMAEVKFHIGMPIFVARQWVRHRMASLNEYSGRYSVMPLMFYTPDKLTRQSSGTYFHWQLERNRKRGAGLYNLMINNDVSRELARIDLPLSTYTFWYWKCDIRNLLHFIGLRSDSHAQKEIRVYSDIIAAMIQKMFPYTFSAFIDYHFVSTTFTIEEMRLMRSIVSGNLNDKQIDALLSHSGLGEGERREFKEKLNVKTRPTFNLDFSLAKTPEYFEHLIQEYVREA
jgi:thymidylate synthase (FAD)